MSKDKPSLGTGLDSLLGSRSDSESNPVSQISVEDLTSGQYQPRTKMHKLTLEELSQSIKEQGVLQPLIVRRTASGRFEIVVGERRWRASQMAGLSSVPAIIRDLNNSETAKIALIENLQREDLNSMDEARGLHRLQREFNLTQEELSLSVGKSRSSVTNLLRLLKLNAEVQEMLEEGKIEMGHARAILTLSEAEQLELAKQVVEQSMSVRQCESAVSAFSPNKKPKRTNSKTKDPNTKLLEKELSELLGSPVQITHNTQGKGRLTVSFKNLDALQGVLDRIKS